MATKHTEPPRNVQIGDTQPWEKRVSIYPPVGIPRSTPESRAWRAFEIEALGEPQFFIHLTRPPFRKVKRGPQLNLGADGLYTEATTWIRERLARPTRGHVNLLDWRPIDGSQDREHLHGFLRFQNPTLNALQIAESWQFWWLRDADLQNNLKQLKLEAAVEPYDSTRSRLYLLDHHEFHNRTICPGTRASRPCRRDCFFEKHPGNVKGWRLGDGKPKRTV